MAEWKILILTVNYSMVISNSNGQDTVKGKVKTGKESSQNFLSLYLYAEQ